MGYGKKKLTEEEHRVCILGGTEPPFTGEYVDWKEEGAYHCKVCDEPLFDSSNKYDSGTGWPSFWQPREGVIKYVGNELRCKNCDAHLGHVFEDGPPPTGKRYCINSVALQWIVRHE